MVRRQQQQLDSSVTGTRRGRGGSEQQEFSRVGMIYGADGDPPRRGSSRVSVFASPSATSAPLCVCPLPGTCQHQTTFPPFYREQHRSKSMEKMHASFSQLLEHKSKKWQNLIMFLTCLITYQVLNL